MSCLKPPKPPCHPCFPHPFAYLHTQSVIGTYVVGPFRYSHLDTSPQRLAVWEYMGYNASHVVEFLQAQSDTLTSPNIALDLRIINSYQYT